MPLVWLGWFSGPYDLSVASDFCLPDTSVIPLDVLGSKIKQIQPGSMSTKVFLLEISGPLSPMTGVLNVYQSMRVKYKGLAWPVGMVRSLMDS